MVFGQAAGTAWSRPGFLLGGGLLAAWLCGMAWVWLRKRSIKVYQHGLVFWKSAKPRKELRWREISGVSFAQDEWVILSKKFVRIRAVLYPNQTRPVFLQNYCPKADLPELMTRIKANLYPQLEPELRKNIRDGKRIYFGTISISKDGLYLNTRHLAWELVDKIDIENGLLCISLLDKSQNRFAIHRIPNLELLLPLTQLASEIGLQAESSHKT